MLARLRDRGASIVLICASLYLAVVLGAAIAQTEIVEQDAAYYCEVAERCARGDGLTSLCDRRGPVDGRVELPAPLHAATLWPAVLAAAAAVTGETRITGSVISLVALILALWLATAAVHRGSGASARVAALCAVAALLTREASEVATLPLTDAPSLCLTAAVLLALTAHRPWLAALLGLAAGAVRFQNAALAVPLLGAVAPRWPRRARRTAIAVAAGTAVAAVLWSAPPDPVEGLAVFVDPTHRDSLFRALRWLSLPALAGLWYARRRPEAAPFWLLGLGHLLVLLMHADPSDARPWLFANRHGLPFHLAAAGLTALALHEARGWPRLALALMVCIACGENVARPFKIMRGTPERTGRPELVVLLDHLRRHPLPAGGVVLCHDCDVLALELGIKGVHLRGHAPDPAESAEPALIRQIAARGITHVALTWWEHEHLRARNAWMDGFARCLAPWCESAAALADPPRGARALLLRVPHPDRAPGSAPAGGYDRPR